MIARLLARLLTVVMAPLLAVAVLATSAPRLEAQQSGASALSGLLRDTEIEEILHRQADPIFRAAGLEPRNIQIALIGDNALNAFVTNGQFMGLNTGLILKTKSPSELKGVIAHEAGHIASGHTVRGGEMARAGLRPMLLTLGLAAAAFAIGNADATDAGAALAASAGYYGQLGALAYSREQESRADQAAAGYLERSGQSGRGLVSFFDNFRFEEAMSQARRQPFFQSHPLSSDRIDQLSSRVAALTNYDKADSAVDLAEHEVMKAKILGFMTPRQALITYKETDTGFPARYARAIAYYQLKEPDRALRLLDPLIADQPDNPYLWELKGQIQFEFNRIPDAEISQRRSVELKPDASLLRLNLGQTLIALNDPGKRREGVTELSRALAMENDNVVGWQLLAQAYDRLGDEPRSLWATAEQHYWTGDLRQARNFAGRARERLDRSSTEYRRAADILLAVAAEGVGKPGAGRTGN